MKIPIANIYYLLLYAWEQLGEADVQVNAEDFTTLVDLFAQVLESRTARLMRQGLRRDYIPYTEEVACIRGAVQFAESLRSGAFERRRAICEFEDLSYDIDLNRIVKATIVRLLRVDQLNGVVRQKLHTIVH
jgi:5-methylcytosine-specific restriction enzyme subunit McrC